VVEPGRENTVLAYVLTCSSYGNGRVLPRLAIWQILEAPTTGIAKTLDKPGKVVYNARVRQKRERNRNNHILSEKAVLVRLLPSYFFPPDKPEDVAGTGNRWTQAAFLF
jgi:hypothetical protein